MYLHLLGASTLYALSSTVANLAIDSGGYINGKLYGLGLTASVCWFAWIPIRARLIRVAEVSATQPDSGPITKVPSWAMIAVVMISIPMVWELFQRGENPGLRTLRLLVAIAAIVCLASAAYIKAHFVKRELVSHLGVAKDQLCFAMQAGTSLMWESDIKSGRDLWFGDLQSIYGIPSDSYAGSKGEYLRYVHQDDRKQVSEAIADARENRKLTRQSFVSFSPTGRFDGLYRGASSTTQRRASQSEC